jgi:DNA polymerase III alpha subunit
MDAPVNLDVRSAFSFLWGAFTPDELVRSNKGFPGAHLDKDGVEWMGLLKFDVLGLRRPVP